MSCLDSALPLINFMISLKVRSGWGLFFILLCCLTACAPYPATQPQPPVEMDPVAAFKLRVEELRKKFDISMDQNLIVSQESKEAMFTATRSNTGRRLPYGLGWFVQEHKGMKLIWHYGHAPQAYSSLILKCLDRESTLILLANSDGVSAPFHLGAGDVLKSPFAVAFLEFTNKGI